MKRGDIDAMVLWEPFESQAVAEGDLSRQLPTTIAEGSVLASMAAMLAKLREGQAQAITNLRILGALDNTSTNLMIADADRTIIYMNKSVEKMLRGVEADMRKALPQFSVDKIIGTNMDSFHRNPAHQANLLANLQQQYVSQIAVAGNTFRLTASPVFAPGGQRLGTVVEWLDRTAEVRVEAEVADVVSRAAAGDFSQRLALDGKEGFFKALADGLNGLMDTTASGLGDIAAKAWANRLIRSRNSPARATGLSILRVMRWCTRPSWPTSEPVWTSTTYLSRTPRATPSSKASENPRGHVSGELPSRPPLRLPASCPHLPRQAHRPAYPVHRHP